MNLHEALALLADGKLHARTPLVQVAIESGFATAVKIYVGSSSEAALFAKISERGLRERARGMR